MFKSLHIYQYIYAWEDKYLVPAGNCMWFVIDMVDKVSDCGAQNYGYLVLGGSLDYDLRGVRTVGIYPPTLVST